MLTEVERCDASGFLYQLVSQTNGSIKGVGHLTDVVFIAQTCGLVQQYFYFPTDMQLGTLVNSRTLEYTLERLLRSGHVRDLGTCFSASPQEQPQSTSTRLTAVVNLFNDLDKHAARFLSSYMMAAQSAEEFGWPQEKAGNQGAQALLGWPNEWINACQRIQRRITPQKRPCGQKG